RVGRRPIMMWSLAVYTGFTMVAALAPSYEVFAAARILAGVGIGAESVIVAPYLAEFVPPSQRGWFVGCLAGFFSFGYVAAALLGRLVVPSTDTGWRWAQVVTAVPIVLSPSRTECGGPPGGSFRRSPPMAPMRRSRPGGRVCRPASAFSGDGVCVAAPPSSG
ncbi:MAG TPA: MFS transporter, partial [Lapillicoccus sp.]